MYLTTKFRLGLNTFGGYRTTVFMVVVLMYKVPLNPLPLQVTVVSFIFQILDVHTDSKSIFWKLNLIQIKLIVLTTNLDFQAQIMLMLIDTICENFYCSY